MVKPTTLFAAVVDLLLTPAFSALHSLHMPTNPAGGSSETPSYGTISAMKPFNLMPGGEVTGMVSELDTGASALYHPRRRDPPYLTTVPGYAFGERFGITQ